MKMNWHEHLSSPVAITGPVHEKQFIAIHWYGDPNTAGDVHATARYLAGVTHASVNFVCGSAGGELHAYCLVNPTQIAYGQGDGADGYGNKHGISIECDPRMRPADLEAVAQVVAKIRKDFGVNFPLRPHKHFTNTQCPGTYEARLGDISRRADEINSGKPAAPAPAPVVKPAASKPAPAPAGTNYIPNTHWKVERKTPAETLGQVAQWAGVSVDAIAKFNGIKNVNVIHVGERIWSPKAGFDTWTVDPGDTLAKISDWYRVNHGHNVSVEQLKNANGINNPATETRVGLRLLIP